MSSKVEIRNKNKEATSINSKNFLFGLEKGSKKRRSQIVGVAKVD